MKRTYTVLVLDQSGSMESQKESAVVAYNEQCGQAKLNAKEGEHEIFVSLLTFNSSVFEHLWAVHAEELKYSTAEDYVCVGGTALNDALGYAIEKLLATTDSNDPDVAYLIQVITDGEENSSVMYPRFDHERKLAKLVERVQATGRWTISFIGCNADYLARLAEETSVPIGNMAATTPTSAGLHSAAAAQSAHVGSYYTMRSKGVSTATANLCSLSPDVIGQMEEKTSGGIVVNCTDVNMQAPIASNTTSDCVSDGGGGTAAVPAVNVFTQNIPVNWQHRNVSSTTTTGAN